MRSLVFGCLCKERSEQALSVMADLSTISASDSLLKTARKMVQTNGFKPKVLDMFGGGGTIPFEAANVGASSYSIDSNEMSIFVQKSVLVHAQSIDASKLLQTVSKSGKRVLERLRAATVRLYPKRGDVTTYLWTYSLTCEECGYRFYLAKRHWLSKKKGKNLGLQFIAGHTAQSVQLNEAMAAEKSVAWTGRNGSVECPKCKHVREGIDIRLCKDELVATVSQAPTSGKDFRLPTGDEYPADETIAQAESDALAAIGATLPQTELPVWSGIVNPALYGVKTHADFLNYRQRAVLALLIKELRDEYQHLKKTTSKPIATAVTSLLSGLVDQLVDWNCRLSMWIPQNEQVGRAFCGPGIAMLWDYAETDPISDGPSNLWSKLDRIVAGANAITHLPEPCQVQHAHAQKLPFPSSFFDAIVTDPPYYDNIYYTVLADFFFSWKRLLLEAIEPELFSPTSVDTTHELVASKFRCGDAAHGDYCRELGEAIAEAERVMKPDGIFALLYSHSSIKGWEALIRAYRPTNLIITSVQPLSIERKQRPRAIGSEAVNTCVVFVARQDHTKKAVESLSVMCDRLRSISSELHLELQLAGWQDEDVAVAVYAQGVGMLMNVSSVSSCAHDIEALQAFERVVQEEFPVFKVTSRGSL